MYKKNKRKRKSFSSSTKERETTTKMVDYVHARKRKKIHTADVKIGYVHDVFSIYSVSFIIVLRCIMMIHKK